MSSIHISFEIDVTLTNMCILPQPCPWPHPSRPFEHTDEWPTSHVHPSMILSISTVNLGASCLFIYLLLSILGWTNGDGCASHVPCHHHMLLPSLRQLFHPFLSLDGWYMSSIYPSMLLLRSTSFLESHESLHLTCLLTFIHGSTYEVTNLRFNHLSKEVWSWSFGSLKSKINVDLREKEIDWQNLLVWAKIVIFYTRLPYMTL